MHQNSTLRRLYRALTRPVVPLGREYVELYAVTNYILLFGIAAYLSFMPLFWAVGAEFIVAINLGIVAGFAFAMWIVRRGHLFTATVFGSALVTAQASITTVTLGWGAAFHLHVVLALELGMLFTHVSVRTRLLFAASVALAYLSLLVYSWHVPPHIELSQSWERSLVALNSLVFLGITVGIAAYYAWMVRRNRDKRERTLHTLEDRNERLRVGEQALAAARDEAEEARSAAEAANRAKSMFLANMSHELRTPLNAIIGYSEMISEEAEDDGNEDLAREIQKIRGAGRHLLNLISDVLDLSKIEAGRMGIEYLDFDLRTHVGEIVDTARPLAQENSNRLTVEFDEEVGPMHGDPTKLRQILFNLLSNACKFTKGGEVTLKVRAQSKQGLPGASFAVRDNGIGMQAETVERIFTEFSQADSSTTRNFGGTGLGLAITQRFCNLLSGSVEVDSAPGKGSTFTVWLPLTTKSNATAPNQYISEARDKA